MGCFVPLVLHRARGLPNPRPVCRVHYVVSFDRTDSTRVLCQLIEDKPQPNSDLAVGYVSHALRQKRKQIINVVARMGVVLNLTGKAATVGSAPL